MFELDGAEVNVMLAELFALGLDWAVVSLGFAIV